MINIATAFRVRVEYKELANVSSLVNTDELTKIVYNSAIQTIGNKYKVRTIDPRLGSEDYAHIANVLEESCYFFVGCPLPDDEGRTYPLHLSQAKFNEEAIVVGAATMASSAYNWLNRHQTL